MTQAAALRLRFADGTVGAIADAVPFDPAAGSGAEPPGTPNGPETGPETGAERRSGGGRAAPRAATEGPTTQGRLGL